jgi:hypothetical protein
MAEGVDYIRMTQCRHRCRAILNYVVCSLVPQKGKGSPVPIGQEAGFASETVHVSLVRILMAVFYISHEIEGYFLC